LTGASAIAGALTMAALSGCTPSDNRALPPPVPSSAAVTTRPPPAEPTIEDDGPSDGYPPWMASFQPQKGKTIYIGKGELTAPATANTKPGKAGEMVLKALCDKGTMGVSVEVNGTPRTAQFTCNTERVEVMSLGSVNKGDKLAIDVTGRPEGALYAIMLEYR
jgi:hypothetical protein